MLYTQFQCQGLFGSGEEDLERFLLYMGMVCHFGNITITTQTNFCSSKEATFKNWYQLAQHWQEKIFETLDGGRPVLYHNF